jgi:hypothetical protein
VSGRTLPTSRLLTDGAVPGHIRLCRDDERDVGPKGVCAEVMTRVPSTSRPVKANSEPVNSRQ